MPLSTQARGGSLVGVSRMVNWAGVQRESSSQPNHLPNSSTNKCLKWHEACNVNVLFPCRMRASECQIEIGDEVRSSASTSVCISAHIVAGCGTMCEDCSVPRTSPRNIWRCTGFRWPGYDDTQTRPGRGAQAGTSVPTVSCTPSAAALVLARGGGGED